MTHRRKDGFEPVNLSSLSPSLQKETSSRVHPRHTYRRQTSGQGMDYQVISESVDDQNRTDQALEPPEAPSYGLGLSHLPSPSFGIRRVPVGTRKSPVPALPQSLSPEGPRSALSQASTFQESPQKGTDALSGEWSFSERDASTPGISCYASDVDLVDHHQQRPNVDPDCPTDGDVLTTAWSSMTVSVLVLSIYSTIFSGIFLGIALAKPRWGDRIGVQGKMSYSTATLLSALFSKTVELSFVTVFVALLGQILSRRAFSRSGRSPGISIADMTMRTWIMQPGALITHWRTLKYAAKTLLGVLALLATLSATFYTTAAEALVAPKLKFGPQEHRILSGAVETAFANATYLSQQCNTPVSTIIDPVDRGNTCLQIEYAGQSYHDFSAWLAAWDDASALGNVTASSSLDGRPKPLAMLFDNTTVAGQWIYPSNENITADSASHGRLVQNVTMAMPHTNIFNAVRNPANHIPQPQDLQGQGEYEIIASIPAPTMNILCVGMTADDLEPLIYNATGEGPKHVVPSTVVDGLFNFGNETGQQPAAQFAKIPIVNNTVHNDTAEWGPNAVYLLATPPKTEYHILCSLRAMQYPNCTTKYHASQTGGELSVHCDDDAENTMPYVESDPSATTGMFEQNWKDIGSEWIKSTALSHGVNDANASIARLVTQMIPTYTADNPTQLDPRLPSIAEALGVLAGSTMAMSSNRAPFVHFFNYTGTSLPSPERPVSQYFNATVRYKDFASGGNQDWHGMFYMILFAIFLINVFTLGYLTKQVFWDGQVTDYTEPGNLFAIANLSPPSQSLRGACGGGPSGGMLAKKWQVDMKSSDDTQYDTHAGRRHPHFFFKCMEDDGEGQTWGRESPEVSAHARERKRKSRPKSVHSWYAVDQGESPAVEQYRRLAL